MNDALESALQVVNAAQQAMNILTPAGLRYPSHRPFGQAFMSLVLQLA